MHLKLTGGSRLQGLLYELACRGTTGGRRNGGGVNLDLVLVHTTTAAGRWLRPDMHKLEARHSRDLSIASSFLFSAMSSQ
jgi:hypothetical protein